jgi:cytochrome c peroxidase
MHDGSYATLRAVLDHYNRGGDVVEGLSPEMRPLDLTADEIDDLLAFLDTLNSIEPLTETVPILPQ